MTDKSDVYSLGVVFLEILTGMHPISHGKNIVREVFLLAEHLLEYKNSEYLSSNKSIDVNVYNLLIVHDR